MKNSKKKTFRYISDVQADNRMATYFEHIVYTDEFLFEVNKLRKEFSIPEKGIEEYPTNTESKDLDEVIDNTNFDIPERLDTVNFYEKIAKLCNKFGFDADSWLMVFSVYVVFDTYNPLNFGKSYGIYDMRTDAKNNFSFSKEYSEVYPIAILIDPYTSLTELKDILDKRYKDTIKPMQLKLRDPKNKMANINIIEKRLVPIYQFIKNNIMIPSADLVHLVNKKFKTNWDYTRIDRIKRERNYNKIKE